MSKIFLSVEEYDKIYKNTIGIDLPPFRSSNGMNIFMLKFAKNEYVPGGNFKGNYGRCRITNYSKLKIQMGRKKVIISENACKYVKTSNFGKLFKYPLKNTQTLIKKERERLKYSIWSFPDRFRKDLMENFPYYIDGILSYKDSINEKTRLEIFNKMSLKEQANYLKLINIVNIDLIPSIELPIVIRIDGIDDGALEMQLSTQDEVNHFIEYHSEYYTMGVCYKDLIHFGFQITD